jgi:hypothetical protein
MKGKYLVVLVALFAMALLMAPTAARADTELGMQFLSGAPTNMVTVCDTLAGGCVGQVGAGTLGIDSNPAQGIITYIGGVGGWDTNITSGFGPPHLGLQPLLDIAYADMSSMNGASPLTVLLTVTGLNGPNYPLGLLQAIQSIGGTITSGNMTITTQAWLSSANNWFCSSTSCGSALTSALSFNTKAYSGQSGGSANTGGGPYSITLALTFDNHGQAGGTTGDDQLDIPEPATLSVLGAALLGLGTGIRRKLAKA